jgi:hypothetical protein
VKIMKSKTLLYRSALGDLKVEIFRNLQNYAVKSIFPLLVVGLNSKNDEIRTTSERLLRAGGAEDV